jgi:hypothetical protein
MSTRVRRRRRSARPGRRLGVLSSHGEVALDEQLDPIGIETVGEPVAVRIARIPT